MGVLPQCLVQEHWAGWLKHRGEPPDWDSIFVRSVTVTVVAVGFMIILLLVSTVCPFPWEAQALPAVEPMRAEAFTLKAGDEALGTGTELPEGLWVFRTKGRDLEIRPPHTYTGPFSPALTKEVLVRGFWKGRLTFE